MDLNKTKTIREAILNLINKLDEFNNSMLEKFISQSNEKGLDFRNINKEYLLERMSEHIKAENWVSVANYAFLLRELC